MNTAKKRGRPVKTNKASFKPVITNLNDTILAQIDSYATRNLFNSRSEVIRYALNNLLKHEVSDAFKI